MKNNNEKIQLLNKYIQNSEEIPLKLKDSFFQEIKFTLADKKDYNQIRSLWMNLQQLQNKLNVYFQLNSSYSNHFKNVFDIWFNNEDYYFQVARFQDIIIGFSISMIKKREPIYKEIDVGSFNDIYVLDHLRRNGIGSKFVKNAIDFFKLKKISLVTVGYIQENKEANKFWTNLGFLPKFTSNIFYFAGSIPD